MSSRITPLLLLAVSFVFLGNSSGGYGENGQPEGAGEGEGEAQGEPRPAEIVILPQNVPLEMVSIPAGTFMMGRYPGEKDEWELAAGTRSDRLVG